MFRRITICAVVTAILFSSPLSRAQSTNATATGSITDSSGAAVPGAAVELLNNATNVPSRTTTNNDGLYRITGLIPGTYTARVSMQGFKTSVKDDIVLHVQDVVGLNFSLGVGSVNETMTVESGEPLLQTETTSLSTVVDERTVQDVPLNGRNVMNLVTLVPSVVAQGRTTGNPIQTNSFVNSWGNYQIGGGFANQSATFVDGAPINTSYVNSVSLVPTQDSITEFRIETNDVSTEYGRFSGGVINMSTKSGTNTIHGTVYEYIRNKELNANDWFSNHAGLPRPPFTQNQFGATFSAPIKKDKIFNFFSWEGFHLSTAQTAIYTVPTAAERAGDFSAIPGNIYDPYTTTLNAATGQYTRQQFQGCSGNQPNVICPNRFDPTSQVLLNLLFPLPPPAYANLTSNNYPASGASGGVYNQYVDRLDWNFSDKQHLFARYTYWPVTITEINPFKNVTGDPLQANQDHFVVLGDDFLINRTTSAAFRVSFLRFTFNAIPLSNGFDLGNLGPAWAALAPQVTSSKQHQIPVPNLIGVTNAGGSAAGYQFNSFDTDVTDTSDNFGISGNISKTVGKHNLSFGGELRHIQWFYSQNCDGSGYFTFDPGFTQANPLSSLGSDGGASVASFLLGVPSSGNLQNEYNTSATQWYGGLYIDDNFHINPRLTLHGGLRWEQPGSFSERRNAESVLLPNAVDPLSESTGLNLKGQIARVNTPLYPHATSQLLHWDRFSPRVGFDFSATQSTLVRGGYGISYLPNDVGFQSAPFASPLNLGTTNFNASQNGGLTPYSTISNPFPVGLAQPIGGNASLLGLLEGQNINSPIPTQPYGYVQQWNLNVEHQLGNKSVLKIGYGASKGTHLPLYQLQLNQLPDQYDSLGPALLNSVANPFLNRLPVTSPLNSTPTIPAGILLGPYPQYTGFAAAAPTLGGSTYNSLQVTMRHEFGAGGNIVGNYTWSKLLSNVDSLTGWLEASSPSDQYGAQDQYNLHAEHSVSSNNYPQNFVLSYVLDLPVGRGKRWMGNLSGLSNQVIGGWTLSGITSFISGEPVGLASQGTTLSGVFGAGAPRPNVVPGCNKKIGGSPSSRVNEWFNTACYTEPDSFGFGNDPRIDNGVTAAGVANFDVGLSKMFPLSERLNFQFRAETFNLANHVQFGVPGNTLDNGSFGIVSSQGNFPRIFQFSGRVNF